jgi:hypothetical protein
MVDVRRVQRTEKVALGFFNWHSGRERLPIGAVPDIWLDLIAFERANEVAVKPDYSLAIARKIKEAISSRFSS